MGVTSQVGGHSDAMRIMMAAGASAEIASDNGRTVLIVAAMGGHVEPINVLLEKGVGYP